MERDDELIKNEKRGEEDDEGGGIKGMTSNRLGTDDAE